MPHNNAIPAPQRYIGNVECRHGENEPHDKEHEKELHKRNQDC